MNYTVYHLHSDLSSGVTNIDSVTKYTQYVEYAKSLDMKALGFSEHGCVFEHIKKKEAIEKAGMKYIHGEEFYVTERLTDNEGKKIKDNYHVIIMAKNYEGFLELNELSSIAFNRSNVFTSGSDDHYYYVPRITFDELCATSDNLIITTACLGGILAKGNDNIKSKFIEFLSAHKERCFLEIQHHTNPRQAEYNKYLYQLSQSTGLRLIAGTDTHCLNSTHAKGREMLQKAKGIFFEDEIGWDLTFKTYDELVEEYRKQNALPENVYMEAIENTNLIADMVEPWEIDRSYKYPHLWDNPEEDFKNRVNKGFKKRGCDKFPNKQQYLDRVKTEFEVYKKNDMIEFMLLASDMINFCQDEGIEVGYGRGSVNGSVIAWILNITEMDSIKYNLNFERFASPERRSLADVDTDFASKDREKVEEFLYHKEGLNCCDIITFNTIATKGAVRDMARALYKDSNKNYIDIADDAIELYEKSEEEARKKYPELFYYVDIVNGVIVSIGTHPCGLVVSDLDICKNFGLCTTSNCPYPVSQIYMKEIDSLNYVKLDLLCLDTIQLINDTCKLLNIPRYTPDNINLTDKAVWDSIRDDTTLIFQWESDSAQAYIKKLMSNTTIAKMKQNGANVDMITLFSIGNGAIRPAGASYREELANGDVRKTGCKPIDDFLSDTSGMLVFQCQIIGFLHKFCGFTMGEADIVRRGFAKKTGTEQFVPIIINGGYIDDDKKHYIKGFIQTMYDEYGYDKEQSQKDIVAFIKVIEDASMYLFSSNHATPYSIEGYVSGYLRYYHPVEFLTSALNIFQGDEDKTNKAISYANKVGVKILPIKFRHSSAEYQVDSENKQIYKGLASIKYLNLEVSKKLYEMRSKTFATFFDFLKVNPCDSRQTEILIKLDFFSEFDKSAKLLLLYDLFQKCYSKKDGVYVGKKQFKKTNLFLPIELLNKHAVAEKPTLYNFDEQSLSSMLIEYSAGVVDADISIVDKVAAQQEYLGYITATGKEEDRRYLYIRQVYPCKRKSDGKTWAYTIYTTSVGSGKEASLTVSKSRYDKARIKKGDVVYAERILPKDNSGKRYWHLIDYNVVKK